MKARKMNLTDGQTVTINDNDWTAVINLKEFDSTNTEILRVLLHEDGLNCRIYAMKSTNGQIVAERNLIVSSDSYRTAAAKAIEDCGLTRITAAAI